MYNFLSKKCSKCGLTYFDGSHVCSSIGLTNYIPKFEPLKYVTPDPIIPKFVPLKYVDPDPIIPKTDPIRPLNSMDDRSRWNTLYGYHHTFGPMFPPKFLP